MTFSYDVNFGYCQSSGYWGSYAYINSSKDYINGAAEKTVAQFFDGGSYYTVQIGLSGAVRLVANLQETKYARQS